jgi:hypothetical protein
MTSSKGASQKRAWSIHSNMLLSVLLWAFGAILVDAEMPGRAVLACEVVDC